VEKGAKSRRVYLPAGNWYDWWTDEKARGPAWRERSVDLATLPLYVRAGSIVPLDPVRQYTAQIVNEPTVLKVYSGAEGEFVLYDDDGFSLDYLRQVDSWIRIRWDDRVRTLTIEPDARSKMKSQQSRKFEVLVLPEGARKIVDYTGRRLRVEF